MTMPLKRFVNPFSKRAVAIIAAHPGEWRLDNERHLRDWSGKPIDVPIEDVTPLICTLQNTERDSRWKLDGARR